MEENAQATFSRLLDKAASGVLTPTEATSFWRAAGHTGRGRAAVANAMDDLLRRRAAAGDAKAKMQLNAVAHDEWAAGLSPWEQAKHGVMIIR